MSNSDSPGQNTGVGSLSLLQGIFPTQESNWESNHCRLILYQLSYQGSSDSKAYFNCIVPHGPAPAAPASAFSCSEGSSTFKMSFGLCCLCPGFNCCKQGWGLHCVLASCGGCFCGAQAFKCVYLVDGRCVESSQARDQTCVPCTGRRILNHWTTWEVPKEILI